MQTSGYYVSMLTFSTLPGICLLTDTLFPKILHDKEGNTLKILFSLSKKDTIIDIYCRTLLLESKLIRTEGTKINNIFTNTLCRLSDPTK